MSRNITFTQLVREITDVYGTLLSDRLLSEDAKPNYILNAIAFLQELDKIESFIIGQISNQEIYHFMKLLLDVVGLVSASEGTIQPLRLGDTRLIGRKRDLTGVYKGTDDSIDQNMCATLFQGWIKASNGQVKISKDLRSVIPKNRKSCDFLLETDSIYTLVECKRVSSSLMLSGKDLVDAIKEKVTHWIDSSKLQFDSTIDFLNLNGCCRHVIIDISDYGKNCIRNFADHNIVGLLKPDEITSLMQSIQERHLDGIDILTICWSELFLFDKKPRAFAYRTMPIMINEMANSPVTYEGWTIEFYPSGKSTNEFKELRISSTARSQSWLRASWHSCIDNLVTYGPVVETL